jgi:hypothetical protein
VSRQRVAKGSSDSEFATNDRLPRPRSLEHLSFKTQARITRAKKARIRIDP